MRETRSQLFRSLERDVEGTVHVEYVIVLSLVSVGVALAVGFAGVLLLRLFLFQQRVLLLPLP